MTDAKDRHSARLVNRLCDEVRALAEKVHVIIVAGNHDYIDPSCPFFRFLDNTENVTFLHQPHEMWIPVHGGKEKPSVCLPATRNHEEDWADIDFSQYQYIFCHATFEGCVTENGIVLPGIPVDVFKGFKGSVYSGDIHSPQKLTPTVKGCDYTIEYVGAPYRIDFGDQFEPRVLLLDKDGQHELRFECKDKHLVVIRNYEDLKKAEKAQDIYEGDQVKVRVRLKRADLATWSELRRDIRAFCQRRGWECYGVEPILEESKRVEVPGNVTVVRDPRQIVEAYGKANKLGKAVLDLGLSLLTK